MDPNDHYEINTADVVWRIGTGQRQKMNLKAILCTIPHLLGSY